METTLRKPSIWHRSLKNNVDRVLSACYRQNFVNIVLSLTYRKIVSINCFMLSDLQTKLCWHCFYFNLHTKLCRPYFKFNLQTKLGQHCFSQSYIVHFKTSPQSVHLKKNKYIYIRYEGRIFTKYGILNWLSVSVKL